MRAEKDSERSGRRETKRTRISSQNTTNKMRRFSIYLFLQDTLHVSDGFSVHHQELKPHIQRQVFVKPVLLPAASLARLAAGSR